MRKHWGLMVFFCNITYFIVIQQISYKEDLEKDLNYNTVLQHQEMVVATSEEAMDRCAPHIFSRKNMSKRSITNCDYKTNANFELYKLSKLISIN